MESDSDSSLSDFMGGGIGQMSMEEDNLPLPPPRQGSSMNEQPEALLDELRRLEGAMLSSSSSFELLPDSPIDSRECKHCLRESVEHFFRGEYLSVVEKSPLSAKLFASALPGLLPPDLVRQKVDEFVQEGASSTISAFLTCISSFNLYLQSNYTGPSLDPDVVSSSLFKIAGSKHAVETNSRADQNNLAVDGDLITPVATNVIFFSVARSILHVLSSKSRHLFSTLQVWKLRIVRAHFALLQFDGKSLPPPPFSPTLWAELQDTMKDLMYDGCKGVLKGEGKKIKHLMC